MEALKSRCKRLVASRTFDLSISVVILLNAALVGVASYTSAAITTFHVVWFSLAAFLLLNLLVGAVVNNCQIIMDDIRAQRDKKAGPGPAVA
jgi:hypothetical protein